MRQLVQAATSASVLISIYFCVRQRPVIEVTWGLSHFRVVDGGVSSCYCGASVFRKLKWNIKPSTDSERKHWCKVLLARGSSKRKLFT